MSTRGTPDVDGCVSPTLRDISGSSRYRSYYPCQLLGTAIVMPGLPPVFLFYLPVLAASAVFTTLKYCRASAATSSPTYNID